MPELTEKTLGSEEIFKGRVFSVELRDVALPDGSESNREIVHHSGGACIVALTDDMKIPLVRQFRSPLEKVLLELPAGKVEPGEDPLHCAQRELIEECGFEADSWEELSAIYSSPGFLSEKITIYLARDLKDLGSQHLDPGEFLTSELYDLSEIRTLLATGQIEDAKTALGLYKLLYLIEAGELGE